MHQSLDSLEIPENKRQELKSIGYNYCKDVNINIPYWDLLTTAPITKTALELYNEELKIGFLPTFIDTFDNALGGGIPIGKITEFCGEPGSGKSQLCFQLCVAVQLPTWCGGLGGEAIYVSTNQGFASHKIRDTAQAVLKRYEILKAKHAVESKRKFEEFSIDMILTNIAHIYISDHFELISLLTHLRDWINNHPLVRLVVIDSISAPIKIINGTEHTMVVYKFLKDLQKLANEFSFAIVLTNDITTRFTSSKDSFQTPSLGGSYYHRINLRIKLEKKSTYVFKAIVLKNVLMPESTFEFSLIS